MKHIGNLLLGWMMLGDVRRKLDPHFFHLYRLYIITIYSTTMVVLAATIARTS